MITKRTVLVLGAGASMPYDFPSGSELVKRILASPIPIHDALRIDSHTVGDNREKFYTQLARSMSSSIDTFLGGHDGEFDRIGKMAIAKALMPLEHEGRLLNRENKDDWYSHLVNKLGSDRKTLHENQLGVVTFNYDRSLEHFLNITLTNRFDQETAVRFLKTIPIVHVHGQLGPYDPLKPNYSTDPKPDDIRRAAADIRIMPEQISDSELFESARAQLARAERIYFIGFGFHETNVRRLKLTAVNVDSDVWGSALGMTGEEMGEAQRRSFDRTRGGFLMQAAALQFLRNVTALDDPGKTALVGDRAIP